MGKRGHTKQLEFYLNLIGQNLKILCDIISYIKALHLCFFVHSLSGLGCVALHVVSACRDVQSEQVGGAGNWAFNKSLAV